MKILFVSSGNKKEGISSLIYVQGESIKKLGNDLTYYTIKGKGIRGYLKNIFLLRKYLKNEKFDVVHAHYSLSGIVAALSGAKPLVVSLMGSDVKQNGVLRLVIKLFNYFFWDACIVKTEDMQKSLGIKNLSVIPNGVNMNFFSPMAKKEAQIRLGWDKNKTHILFAADPVRREKNYDLAKKACNIFADNFTELHFLKNVLKDEMPYYYSASDVVLLTSFWEGSPNVIKEAMACCRPIVATDVGDIRKIIGNTQGCFVCDFNPYEIANALVKAKKVNETKGRFSIEYLKEEVIAKEIFKIYDKVRVRTYKRA